MDKGSTDSPWGKFNSGIVMALVALPLTILFKASGDGISVVTASIAAVIWLVGVLICGLLARHYDGQLAGSAEPSASEEYKTYRTLRTSIETGGRATEVYASQLVAFLTWIDAFFGDSKRAEDAVRPAEPAKWLRKLGFQRVYPMWTVPSYDRCLQLALIYPLAVIFIGWVISGEVGQAEQALGLQRTELWRRILSGCELVAGAFGLVKFLTTRGAARVVESSPSPQLLARVAMGAFVVVIGFAFVAALIFALDFAVTGVGIVVVALALALAVAFAFAFAGVVAGVVAGLGAIAIAIAIAVSLVGVDASAGIGVIGGAAGLVLTVAGTVAAAPRLPGAYVLFALLYLAFFYASEMWLANNPGWQRSASPSLLFLPLLTLLNAPFDWFSLGLTRMLLRLGLEKQGWWPYGLCLARCADCGAGGFVAELCRRGRHSEL